MTVWFSCILEAGQLALAGARIDFRAYGTGGLYGLRPPEVDLKFPRGVSLDYFHTCINGLICVYLPCYE